MLVLISRWIAPMSSPMIGDGAVAIRGGRIVSLGTRLDVVRQYAGAVVHDLGDAVLLPGLINAHTHLELTGCACGDSPASFTDWLMSLAGRVGPNRDFAAVVRVGVEQSMQFGVTTVGDISQFPEQTRPVLRSLPIRAVSFGEALGITARRLRFSSLLTRAIDPSMQSDRVRIGVSPHAPYTVDSDGYREAISAADAHGLPLATHLAETPFEVEFLDRRAGPFGDVYANLMKQDVTAFPTFAGGPIRFAKAVGLLDRQSLLAHVNYCDDDELAILAAGQASVVYCPRTHAYFRHTPHRWREMLAAGINVAVGTDSCASSPDLNLVDDLRLLHRIAPEVSGDTLWQMATTRAAKAIGCGGVCGELGIGSAADLVAFKAGGGDPLISILESDSRPIGVWIDGNAVLE